MIKLAFATAAATVLMVSITTLATPAQAVIGNCICPDVYAPVQVFERKDLPELLRRKLQPCDRLRPDGRHLARPST
jgi:hypothetical protein